MRVYTVFVLLFSYVSSVTVNKLTHKIVADSREELSPILVKCRLEDFVILSVPIVTDDVTSFLLTSPNGDTRHLDLPKAKNSTQIDSVELSINVSFTNKHRVILSPRKHITFNLNRGIISRKYSPTFEQFAEAMVSGQYMIGPLGVEDHGKWLLKMLANENGKWFEMTQVINIEIREYILVNRPMTKLRTGDTFRFGFMHSIPDLKKCDVVAPIASLVQWNDFNQMNPQCDIKEQLPPYHLSCSLNDVLVLSAPIVNHNVTIFQLTSPKGDTRSLDLKLTKSALKPDSHENSVVIKYNKGKHRVINWLNNYKLFSINTGKLEDVNNTLFKENEEQMKPNDFMIGPLSEDDHGNWVLSLFAKENGRSLEMFQVISIEIREIVAPKQRTQTLKTGDTFRFGFAYPIKNLESCQFTAPKTTYDRWYDRDQDNLDSCMFVVKNVTKADAGLWMVVGVGRIVFFTMSFLNVN